MNKALFVLVSFALSSISLAHEGHGVPGALQAKHGGTIKGGNAVYLELVQEGEQLKLYPMTHELEPIPLGELRLEATAQLPRAKEKKPVPFSARTAAQSVDSHFSGSVQAQGAHRFSLEVTAHYQGKKDRVVFQVEPR
jgi:hypothetical protein